MYISQVSTNTLLVSFGSSISQETSLCVQKVYHSMKALQGKGIYELIPSYTTILISYDIFKYSFQEMSELIVTRVDLSMQLKKEEEIVHIDVYYGQEVGLDLEKISNEKKISVEEIISLHTEKLYDVYAIGFLPGFGFLGEVDTKIASARLHTPRKKVLQGSVGIADRQTAVYPEDSAGGWNIIGKTTHKLFDRSLEELSPLSVGKKVIFHSISKSEFLANGGVV